MELKGTAGSVTGERVYRKNPEVVSRSIAGEFFLVPIRGRMADMQHIFSLNPVGQYIWQELDGNKNLLEIRSLVASDFDVSRESAESDIQEFIGELLAAELIIGE
ncbi:MAG: hypothetical protein C0402_08200 [Thermodesulfovibrio sp.]|nr:hypothetical protein [Thermodesulfovibrio sp.]